MPYEEITVGRLYSMKVNWYLAGLRFCAKAAQLHVGPNRLSTLRQHCAKGVEACLPYLESTAQLPKREWQRHWAGDRSEENEIFELAVSACTGLIPAADAVAIMKNCYIRLLNSFEWKVIDKQVQLEGRAWTSRITPMNQHYSERIGGGGIFRSYGSTGMGSMTPRLTAVPGDPRTDEENYRITNFWMTELLYEGLPMFSGFRSGSLSGKLIGDSDATINRRNAQQLFDTIALEEAYRQTTWRARFAEAQDKTIMLVSINLQTGNKIGGEGRMIADQKSSLAMILNTVYGDDDIADADVPRPVRRERLSAYDLEALSFNCEVNNIGGLTPWSNNNSEAAWTSLFNKAAFYSHALRKRDDTWSTFSRKAISALLKKFHETSKRDLLRPSNDYKIASRLALLAYLAGCHVHFNCKSGKDRTGLMDIEIKRLFASMYGSFLANGEVTVPKYSLSGNDAEKGSYRTLLQHSGNFEVQECNTGGRGFKVAQLAKIKIVSSDRKLANRFGSDGGLEYAFGLKDFMDIDDLGKDSVPR